MMLQIYQKKLDLSKRLLDEYHAKEKTFLDNVGKIFNGDQIVRILTGHCQKRRGGSSWDDGTLKKAAKLYFLCSPQGYQEILHLKMPLPSSHTLQNVIQKGRPQPLSPKTSVFDPFASTSDLSSSIALVRRAIVQQSRQSDSVLTNTAASLQQQQQPSVQQEIYPPQSQLVVPNSSPTVQLQFIGPTSVPSISASSTGHSPAGSTGMAIQPTLVFPMTSSVQKTAHNNLCTSKVSSLDIPDDLASMVNAVRSPTDECEVSAITEGDRLNEEEVLNEAIGPETHLVCSAGDIELPPPVDEQVNSESTTPREMSVERAVGAVVRALVDQVARPTSIPSARPRGAYVSILRNLNDPTSLGKYNLVVPRHLLRPGQRIVLKTGASSVKTSPPTMQIVEPLKSTGSAVMVPTLTGASGMRQVSIASPATAGGQVVNISKRPLMSPAPTMFLRPPCSGLSLTSASHGQPIIEIAADNIGDIVSPPSLSKRPRLSD
ncbi:hypothetical protein BIW11_03345 [Tropilaelaps mercedesae]|uniref:Uncharacterized protein n=1 Tax=Tropilaelaps mercedesae TaxID=418985 RepID=A0A1V9XNA1_9ACAR|nr:hypothetical protein BIW11_03345 [Tropilaelaps mercedesae]